MFRKVLVANRGEIAIRAFRAAYELGIGTVAVYPLEDRNSVHRTKADESYQIGEPGHPVRAYLSVEAIIDAARAAGADAIYPGYGFLSENPDLAAACAGVGIIFVGPSAQVLELTGNKARAIAAAKAAGLPVLASSEPSTDIDTLMAAAESMTFPVFVKAVAGGGGRGMRRVGEISGLRDAIEAAAREAQSAFGDAAVFLEQAVIEPRHIEVQILADTHGNVIHLFERDCSVQRRHQKVVELAPAPNISAQLRSRLCADAVAFARQIGYSCAGTVEFLVDKDGNHVFIEMNPRIQVEHTVTEEITDVDLVQAQLRVAAGETLADIGLAQENIQIRGAALQCRITTEDPANGFRPDIGRITAYRTAEGAGIPCPKVPGGTQTSMFQWSLTAQTDGAFSGTQRQVVTTNDCGFQGVTWVLGLTSATRIGDVPKGVTVADPATVTLPPALEAGNPTLGQRCTDTDRLVYDPYTDSYIVCTGTNWDPAPLIAGIRTTGAGCVVQAGQFMATSEDGYLIACVHESATGPAVWKRSRS
jgi:pyruvate carboxylase